MMTNAAFYRAIGNDKLAEYYTSYKEHTGKKSLSDDADNFVVAMLDPAATAFGIVLTAPALRSYRRKCGDDRLVSYRYGKGKTEQQAPDIPAKHADAEIVGIMTEVRDLLKSIDIALVDIQTAAKLLAS